MIFYIRKKSGYFILRLNLNGMNILDWFQQKYQELQKTVGTSFVKNKIELGKKKNFDYKFC